MSFMDFLTGSNNAPLSLAEVLSAIPAVAGPALMARGRRVGLPLGMGLTALGGLGEMMAQRQRQNAQAQGLSKAIGEMPGLTPDQQKSLSDAVAAGVNPAPMYAELLKRQFTQPATMKPFTIMNLENKQERIFNPAIEGNQLPPGWISASFKPGQGRTTPLKTIYGPKGATEEVGVSAGYTPPAGWSLKAPEKPPEAPLPLVVPVTGPGGATASMAVFPRTRTSVGSPSLVPLPTGVVPGKPKLPPAPTPIKPTEANAVTKQIDNEWALQPTEVSGAFSGARKRAFYAKRRAEIYANMGYDSNGQPFKPGQVVGRTATGDPIVWNP